MASPTRAQITGEDVCTGAGICVKNSAPVLALCRALVEAGHDPSLPLEAYRGETLCLRVRSIGEGAMLRVNPKGNGFTRTHTAAHRVNRRGPALAPETSEKRIGTPVGT